MEDKSFVNSVLLHGYSLDNIGLMYGKLGVSLSLFEYSRCFNDGLAEKHAFELLQETLVSSVKEYAFNRGGMGIAWSLIYLISNQYIEAEYQELYGREHEDILAFIKRIKNETINVTSHIDAIPFLMISKKYIPESDFKNMLSLFRKFTQ